MAGACPETLAEETHKLPPNTDVSHYIMCALLSPPPQSVIIISTMRVSCSLNTLLHQYVKETQAVMAAALSVLCRWKWGSFLFKGSVWDLTVWVYFKKVAERNSGSGGWDDLGLIFSQSLTLKCTQFFCPPVKSQTWNIDSNSHCCAKCAVNKSQQWFTVAQQQSLVMAIIQTKGKCARHGMYYKNIPVVTPAMLLI